MEPKTRRKIIQVLKVHTYIDPIFFYLPIIYGLSKFYQWSSGEVESVWERLWLKTQEIFGE